MLRALNLARLSGGLRNFVRDPLTVEAAMRDLRRRIEQREERFLQAMRRLVYDNPTSPYLPLLRRAGCAHADLEAAVRSHGVERALEDLRDAGVRLSLEEFRARRPIERDGTVITADPCDFENPLARGGPVSARSSGTRAPSVHVKYNWEGLAEDAAFELLLHESNGDAGAPIAFWYPAPPASAGLRNLLMHLRIGRPPLRWFSQTAVPSWRSAPIKALGLAHLAREAARQGLEAPRPTAIGPDEAGVVARWMADALSRHGAAVLMTFASSAVRLSLAAKAEGLDLRGGLVYSGGEPLTDDRRRTIESSGLIVRARYVATETGPIGGQCRAMSDDCMHLLDDRLAVIQDEPEAPGDTDDNGRLLLFTSLSIHCARVLINTEIGDAALLSTGECACPLGQVGLGRRVAAVRAHHKCTIEGMTVDASRLEAVVAETMSDLGAPPHVFQLEESIGRNGRGRLVITVDSSVPGLDEAALEHAVLKVLSRSLPDGALTAEIWRQAGALTVVRAPLQTTTSGKAPRFRHAEA